MSYSLKINKNSYKGITDATFIINNVSSTEDAEDCKAKVQSTLKTFNYTAGSWVLAIISGGNENYDHQVLGLEWVSVKGFSFGTNKGKRLYAIPNNNFEMVSLDESGTCHSVTGYIFDKYGNTCFVKQTADRKSGPPSGGIHPGEDLKDGLCREVLEETGLDISTAKITKIYSTIRGVHNPFSPKNKNGNEVDIARRIFNVFHIRLDDSVDLRNEVCESFNSADGEICHIHLIKYDGNKFIKPPGMELNRVIRSTKADLDFMTRNRLNHKFHERHADVAAPEITQIKTLANSLILTKGWGNRK